MPSEKNLGSGKTLVIVESPTKAKTITKFLGTGFVVKASNGHIRDLPNNAAEIPESLKKSPWAKVGVNVEKDFEPLYIVPPRKKENVKALKEALKNASKLFLATDEDREGESISWHIIEELKPKIPYKRLVFHEITKEAIQNALDSARDLDENLVKAQETRRIVDRLFGYEVSPLLWKKMAPGLSAGRVQSVAVRLLVARERERIAFRSASYWGVSAKFHKIADTTTPFQAELTHVGERRIAIGRDFDPKTGKLLPVRDQSEGVVSLDRSTAEALEKELMRCSAKVSSVEEKPFVNKPSAPFVTSTLQQEGNRKLRFSAKRTMTIAQQLYENGFITYMRTDSTTLSQEALAGARRAVEQEFGREYLLPSPREYATKVKNAQEAHEAIRPAGEKFAHPEVVRSQLGEEAYRLYDLIWKRTLASQMPDARGTHIVVTVVCDTKAAGPDLAAARFRATGKTIEFAGFLRAYAESSDDGEGDLSDQEKILPKLEQNESLKISEAEAGEHSTQPPARYTEGSLIKELERLGIGRPSTWATVVELVLNRSYAFKKGTALVPTFVACTVCGLLETHFPLLLDYDFTARLEDDLDAISRGEAGNLKYLREFYYGNGHPGLHALVKAGEKDIDPRIVCGLSLGTDSEGRQLEVRIGRYGPFISDGTIRASVPDMLAPDEVTLDVARSLLDTAAKGPSSLGPHPETGEPVYVKSGRFGPYVQLGDAGDGVKPKMVSLLAGTDPAAVDLAHAVKLLSLPRTLGEHPETKQPVLAALGRFGPYIRSANETRSLPGDGPNVLEVTLDQAIELLKQPKSQRRGSKPKALREIGQHPVSKLTVSVFSGRYGPYVTDGSINASLAKGMDPEKITMDDAVNLLDARAARIAENGGAPKKRRGARSGDGRSAGSKTPKDSTSSAPSAETQPKTKGGKKRAATSDALSPGAAAKTAKGKGSQKEKRAASS